MMKHCENSCGGCEFVNRGHDDCCHEVFWISDRCPFYELILLATKVNNSRPHVEWVTSYLGCVHFKLDEEYKRWNEEVDRMNKERNEKHKQSQENYSGFAQGDPIQRLDDTPFSQGDPIEKLR